MWNTAYSSCSNVLPRLQTRVEEYLTKELPELSWVFLDRTVPELIVEHVQEVFKSCLVDKITLLIRDEVVAALAPK